MLTIFNDFFSGQKQLKRRELVSRLTDQTSEWRTVTGKASQIWFSTTVIGFQKREKKIHRKLHRKYIKDRRSQNLGEEKKRNDFVNFIREINVTCERLFSFRKSRVFLFFLPSLLGIAFSPFWMFHGRIEFIFFAVFSKNFLIF